MPTLQTYRRALAYALDDQEQATLSGGSATTAVSSSWINTTPGAASPLYVGRWIFNTTKVAVAKVSGYDPTTGTLTVTPAWTAAAAGDVVELSSLFPAIPAAGAETDYRAIVIRALKRMGFPVEIDLPITTSDVYALTAFTWLDRPARLRGVREPSPHPFATAPIDASWRSWELVPDPPASSLRVRSPFFTATGSLAVEALRPADTWIKPTAGSWGESSTGPLLDADEAQPEALEFLPFALLEAMAMLIARSPGRPSAEWQRLLETATADVERSRYRDLTRERGPHEGPQLRGDPTFMGSRPATPAAAAAGVTD